MSIFALNFLFSIITSPHKYAIIINIAMFLYIKIEILEITVNIIITMFAMLFVIVYDLYSPAKICTNSFKILPPSNGYIGNRIYLNILLNQLEVLELLSFVLIYNISLQFL
jgi:hypothetical protein